MNVNIYNPYVREELELYHHGIAGQRWGSRNGPPYPLSAGAHSASEKKAGWRKSLYKDGKETHFSKKVEKYVSKSERKGFNARRGQKALNLIERQKAKDTYQMRKAANGGNKEAADTYAKRIKQGEAKTKSILSDLNKKGYTIGSAKVMRDANYGKKLAVRTLVVTGPLSTAVLIGQAYTSGNKGAVLGKRYKVSKKSNPGFLRKERQGRNWDNTNNTVANELSKTYAAIGGAGFVNRRSNYRRVR